MSKIYRFFTGAPLAIMLAASAIAAGVFGWVEYDRGTSLAAQLASTAAALDQANTQQTRLHEQLSAAQDRINSQGTKLTAAEQQASAEEHQASAAEQQLHADQEQLDVARRQLAREQQELAVARRQMEDEKRELGNLKSQLAEASRPDLPVQLAFFNAQRGDGKVVVLQNLSASDLDLTLDVQSPGIDAHLRKQVSLAARATLRLGPAQGWSFRTGQVITLDNARFRRSVRTVS